jgi:hypothetical protein
MLRRHLSCRRDHRLPGGQTVGMLGSTNLFTFLFDFRPACAMNRAIDAAASHQRTIGGIDNGIDYFFGNITGLNGNPPI